MTTSATKGFIRGCSTPQTILELTAAGQREKPWQEFFSHAWQWWDCRSEKVTARYPDFKHKKMHKHTLA